MLACTGAGRTARRPSTSSQRRAAGVDAPLLIVDIAVPRDVDAGVAELPGVTLLDLDDLRDWADRGRRHRAGEAERVRAIVAEEVERFAHRGHRPPGGAARRRAARARRGGPRRRARAVRGAAGRRSTTAQREAVEALTRGIVAKLLHEPSVRLKHEAGTPQGERNAAAVRDLFDLG